MTSISHIPKILWQKSNPDNYNANHYLLSYSQNNNNDFLSIANQHANIVTRSKIIMLAIITGVNLKCQKHDRVVIKAVTGKIKFTRILNINIFG